jgi:uncharacterized membrane protein
MLEVVTALKSYEKAHRSVVKAITNRALSLISDFTLVTYITGKPTDTLHIIVMTNISSTILYFVHERIWNHIDWGRDVINPVRHKVHERSSRSLAKALTYRTLGFLFDASIISLITNDTTTTITIVVLTNIASTVVYLINERIWNRFHWGKHVHAHI